MEKRLYFFTEKIEKSKKNDLRGSRKRPSARGDVRRT